MARTSGVWRWVIDNLGDHSTGVASIYAQECARDKPIFHVALSAGRRLLVGLWSFTELAASNSVECNIIGSYVHNAVCKGQVWEIIQADKWVRKTSGGLLLPKPERHAVELLNTTSECFIGSSVSPREASKLGLIHPHPYCLC